VTDSEAAADPDSTSVTLVVRRLISATADTLFDAWTKPADLMSWWGPGGVACPEAQVDLRVGGRCRIANRFPDGVVWILWEFEVIEPPHKLVYTWRLEQSSGASERVTVRFEPRDNATEVIVIHERIRDVATRDRHEHGWHGCLDGLAEYVGKGSGAL
jgi:uncharacterized protein YndB with AHSA1/START domain